LMDKRVSAATSAGTVKKYELRHAKAPVGCEFANSSAIDSLPSRLYSRRQRKKWFEFPIPQWESAKPRRADRARVARPL